MDRDVERLTVREAAKLLDVGVSTLKRWTDSGVLESYRTVGGHRRLSRNEVERFRHHRGGNHESWIDLLLDEDDLHLLASSLLHARARHPGWWCVADELGQALVELGRRWEAGEVTVLQEHMASERLARVLQWVGLPLPLAVDAPVALLAMAQDDDHTLGLSLAELTLREAGWATRWAGRDAPVGDIVSAAQRGEVQLVALSASCLSTDAAALLLQYEALTDVARQLGVLLVLGGSGAWPDAPTAAHRLHSFGELHHLLTDRADA